MPAGVSTTAPPPMPPPPACAVEGALAPCPRARSAEVAVVPAGVLARASFLEFAPESDPERGSVGPGAALVASSAEGASSFDRATSRRPVLGAVACAVASAAAPPGGAARRSDEGVATRDSWLSLAALVARRTADERAEPPSTSADARPGLADPNEIASARDSCLELDSIVMTRSADIAVKAAAQRADLDTVSGRLDTGSDSSRAVASATTRRETASVPCRNSSADVVRS